MPTFDVRMNKAAEPRFPPICIGCGGSPTTSVRVRRDSVGWHSLVRFGWLYGIATGRRIQVPACESCARMMRNQRLRRAALEWTLIIGGIVLGIWLFREWDGLAKRLAIMGLAVLVAAPTIVWEVIFPPLVDITVTEGTVTYHFADRDYAELFAEENGVLL